MQNKVGRIIIDTNLWISFLIKKYFSKLDEIIFSRPCILIFSQELLDEFLEVSRRPKFRRFFSPVDIEDKLETIDEYADFVKVYTKIEICRDPKDNFLLSLSIDGIADFLLTGDFGIPSKQITRTPNKSIAEIRAGHWNFGSGSSAASVRSDVFQSVGISGPDQHQYPNIGNTYHCMS